jgi:GxxExxY protein
MTSKQTITTILGLAKNVMRELHIGHRETVYGKALQHSFNHFGLGFRSEIHCPIYYMNTIIGYGRADFIVGDFVIEIKANKLAPDHANDQIVKYMKSLQKAEGKSYQGLIINFNQSSGKIDMLLVEPLPEKVKAKTVVVRSRFFNKKK